MARPAQQRGRLGAVLLLLLAAALLVSLCHLARADAAAAADSTGHGWNSKLKGLASAATEKVAAQQEVAPERAATTAAAAADEEEAAPVLVPERVLMEITQDYGQTGANQRHSNYPHPHP
ncbi:hypothetical protein ACP70R_031387 [Stipagrostis hirtigluma subsp. patula]